MEVHTDVVRPRATSEPFRRAVGRPIVDNNDLEGTRERYSEGLVKCPLHSIDLVEDRHENRKPVYQVRPLHRRRR
jgi:hypothetical protein